MKIGSAFDDIVDHPIMGREWHVPPLTFQVCVYERRDDVSFAPAQPELAGK
ncbi:MAG TPA: hypothetical protein VGJ51_09240 [Candidatus Angelobacter sp.]|jgi:hypothetical protein